MNVIGYETMECGRDGCIILYSSEDCLFCEVVKEHLLDLLKEHAISNEIICIIDDQLQLQQLGINCLPLTKICNSELTGLVERDDLNNHLLETILLKECFGSVNT